MIGKCIAQSHSGNRCRHDGVVRYELGMVCRGHHNHGFIPFALGAEAERDDAIALRMKAVLDDR